MKWHLIGLMLFLVALDVTSQELHLDSLLEHRVDSSEFSNEHWYWIEIIPHQSTDYIELSGWGHVKAYLLNDSQETGTLLPSNKKNYKSHKNIIQTSGDTLLVKVKGDHPLFDLDKAVINEYTANHWREQERQRLIAHGFFFGIVVVMALYNLMIFLAVKDQSYLWYVLSIVGFGLYMAFYYGFTYEHFWPSQPHWNSYFFALIIPLTNICRILFTKTYLHTEQYVPKWNAFFKLMVYLYLVPISMWLISWLEIRSWLVETNYAIGALGAITMTAITVTSVVVYTRGYKPALWFLVAFALFNIGGILFIFRELNYLQDNFFTRYIVQIGAVAQVVLFSLGLSDRLNRTRKMLANETIEKEKLAREKEKEKKKLIEKQRNQLEKQVKTRTKELEKTLEQLQLSEQELRELNLLKSKLFSIISHELKSPLTTVDSYLNLFIKHYKKLSPEELSDLSDKTRFSLQNLILLMDNLLLWSRLQQDSLNFVPTKVDLRKTIDKSIKLFTPLIEDKKISLSFGEEIDEIVLLADKDMLEFVIRNLIHNAIKFTPKNGQISLSGQNVNGFAYVSIEDTGVGMSREMVDQILTKGDSLTTEGTEHEKGSGIGLLMCKDFVEKNGGKLEIKKSKGTVVSFTIPVFT